MRRYGAGPDEARTPGIFFLGLGWAPAKRAGWHDATSLRIDVAGEIVDPHDAAPADFMGWNGKNSGSKLISSRLELHGERGGGIDERQQEAAWMARREDF
jgi:hypothetical protein